MHCDTEAEGLHKIGKYLHTLCECPFFVEDARRVLAFRVVIWLVGLLIIW